MTVGVDHTNIVTPNLPEDISGLYNIDVTPVAPYAAGANGYSSAGDAENVIDSIVELQASVTTLAEVINDINEAIQTRRINLGPTITVTTPV